MSANDLARKMAERIAAMEPGASETIARVACEVSGADYCFQPVDNLGYVKRKD